MEMDVATPDCLSKPETINEVHIPLDERRLWVGNLDARVNEYHLIKLLRNYGEIEKFDMMFHRSGPYVDMPRGFAFVTFKTVSDANNTREKLNGKLVMGKKISIQLAGNAETSEIDYKKEKLKVIPALSGTRNEVKVKPTRETAIEQIQYKLQQLEKNKNEFVFNESVANKTSILQQYQYNMNVQQNTRFKKKWDKDRKPYGRGRR